MKNITVFLICGILLCSGQIKSKANDAFLELESNALTLRFMNAVNGQPIAGAAGRIGTMGEFVSDAEGKVSFPAPDHDGPLPVSISAAGFITTDFSVEIMAGTLFFNRISISPELDLKLIRIVVDWGKEPLDLDAHFLRLGSGGYHISFRTMRVLTDGSGLLDIDATQGYGPETITVKELSNNANYEYFVHDYSNRQVKGSNRLADSRATVKVYGDGKLMHFLSVPQNRRGSLWKVFTITKGKLTILNTIVEE